MIGVRFTRAVRPYGAGDTAWLPEDAAQAVVDSGEAELYQFPQDPHGHEAGAVGRDYAVPVTKPMLPGRDYRTKKGR